MQFIPLMLREHSVYSSIAQAQFFPIGGNLCKGVASYTVFSLHIMDDFQNSV